MPRIAASDLSRAIVPGVSAKVDAVVYRAAGALALAAVGVGFTWATAGRDGLVTDPEVPWLWGGAACGVGAVLLLVLTAVAVFGAQREITRSAGRRFGRARIAVAALAAVAGVVVAGVVTVPRASDARRLETDDSAVARAAKNRSKLRPLSAPLTLIDVMQQRVGTCLVWPEGPTKADLLDHLADPSGIRSLDCSSPHGYEVVGIVHFPIQPGLGYPNVAARRKTLDGACDLQLLAYLTAKGKAPVRTSSYGVYGLAPPAVDWAVGQRIGVCVAVPPDDATRRTSSLEGSG